jgi:hypothetical protein
VANNIRDLADVLMHACDTMNERINQIGQIPTSDLTIKTWHTYTNTDWEYILDAVLEIDKLYDVANSLIADIKTLKDHIGQCGHLCDNILYPTPQESVALPRRATTLMQYNPPKTVKTLTFRTMMRIRELYCEIIGLDLPNEDASQGKLNAKPVDNLFEF